MRPPTLTAIAAATLTHLCLPLTRAAEPVDYNRDIRPILSENCFSCHGPDERGRKGKRRLDQAESAYRERNGLAAIKPGKPDESDLWWRISSDDPDELMPPKDSHLALTSQQKALLRKWIEEGAPYAPHWSFVPPRQAPVPLATDNPIDAFIRARLAPAKFQPASEAPRATLIRRATLDLTGLPPSAADVDAFERDHDPAAYERLVDRLLASPHYGERLALDWLDAARYADTNGYSIDGGRHLWLWRDWVIQAFNDNLPYDRFLLEQIAGDLLPNPSPAQMIATGFQRNNMVSHEGGTIDAENLNNYNADRVKTLGESVLGLTLGCAQCHDHKFDPISQEDYYRVYAFFNTLGDRGKDGVGGVNAGPTFQAKTVLRSTELPELRECIAALTKKIATPNPDILAQWEAEQTRLLEQRGTAFALHPVEILKVSTPNRGSGFDAERGNFVRLGVQPNKTAAAFDVSTRLPNLDQPITGLRVIFHPVAELPGGGWGSGPYELPRRRRTDDGDEPAMRVTSSTKPPEKGTFMLTAITVTADVVPSDQVNLHKIQTLSRITANTWDPQHPPSGCFDPREHDGWSPDFRATGPVHLTTTFAEPVDPRTNRYLTVQVNFGHGMNLIPGLFELQVMTGVDDDMELPDAIIDILKTPSHRRTPAQQDALWSYCAAHADATAADRIELANLQERVAVLTSEFETMVMAIAAKPRETFILDRGDYARPTRKVTAGTPAALPPMPADAPNNRLGLARWLTMKDHPLTARVAVNRLWKLCFGTGLVSTPADFGAQGEWPSHAELLDWLAVRFVESGWDVKALLRLIVTSATYRQASETTPTMLERDPYNRLLARGPRFRLPAEFVRDLALKTSGLLVQRLGGPSVNPYAPGDLWREISHYGSTPSTSQTFVQDHGEKLYRRSLYTYWKRTSPPPNMTVFDAPSREVCTLARAETTTPLQALVLLNDPQFVEAARVFAERIHRTSADDNARIQWAFREATARTPSAAEIAILRQTLESERARYAKDPRAAEALLKIGETPRDARMTPGEHAAWTHVASLLFNLNETITRN